MMSKRGKQRHHRRNFRKGCGIRYWVTSNRLQPQAPITVRLVLTTSQHSHNVGGGISSVINSDCRSKMKSNAQWVCCCLLLEYLPRWTRNEYDFTHKNTMSGPECSLHSLTMKLKEWNYKPCLRIWHFCDKSKVNICRTISKRLISGIQRMSCRLCDCTRVYLRLEPCRNDRQSKRRKRLCTFPFRV